MGEPGQTRIIRKLDLERFLSKVKPHPAPNVTLEQYTLSESAAATMLHLAAYAYGDILGKHVLDLGCGTGRLALGSAFLGAKSVVGVDIDRTAVKVALKNSVDIGFKNRVNWVAGDISAVSGKFDTVIQNPPFGVQKRNADRRFLQKAMELGTCVYSLHNHPTFDRRLMDKLKRGAGQFAQVEPSPFIQKLVESSAGQVKAVYALAMVIPHMFDFHKKAKQEIIIDLYVITRKNH